jgi:hypothetical protein
MNKLVIAVSLCTCGVAFAQAGKSEKPGGAAPSGAAVAPSRTAATPPAMEVPKPGPETKALEPFAKSNTSTGTAMMPDGKETPTRGKSTCRWIDGGMWVQCDIEETAGTGKTAQKWLGHWVFGYDQMAKGYRGVMFDNMASMMRVKGTLEGSKLTFESMDELKGPPGMPMPTKMRFSQDATDPKNIKFVEEWYLNGKWTQHGTGTFKTTAK